MNSQGFIEIISKVVRETTITGSIEYLKSPPGRKPPEEVVRLSDWYNNLSIEDKDNLKSIVEMVVDDSLFGILDVLDGVRAIENEKRGLLELHYVKNDEKTLLNNPNDEFLHDIYNRIVR